jgi:sugar lactone lactonase YvrE
VLAVSPGGLVTTVAGTGVKGFAGDGGPARRAALDNATGIAVAADGTLYLGDTGNHRLRAVSPAGVINTVAGNGGRDLTAASGPATDVPLPGAGNPVVDRDGTVWLWAGAILFRLRDGRVAAVTRDGTTWGVSSAGTYDPHGPWLDAGSVAVGDDGVYTYSSMDDEIYRLGAGDVLEAVTDVDEDTWQTSPLLATAPGHLYLADFTGHRVHRVPVQAVGAYTEDRPWWPYAAAAAAAAGVAAIGGWLVLRAARRRRGATREQR